MLARVLLVTCSWASSGVVVVQKSDTPTDVTLIDHLRELRNRVIVSAAAVLVGAVIAFLVYDWIFAFFYRPFAPLENTFGNTLFINTIFEGFTVKLKLSIIAGVILSFPVHIYNIVRFVLPGLLKRERKIVIMTLFVSFALVLFSFYYGYFYIVPLSVRFLTGMGFIPSGVGILLNYGRNIFYVLQFLLLTLLLFQLPVVVEILMIMNILKRRSLLKAARYIVLAIFAVAAVFTPPDFVSQLSVALPLIALFFLTILIARIFRFGEE